MCYFFQIFLLSIFFFISSSSFAQIKLKLNLESGTYINFDNRTSSELISRLQGGISYNKNIGNSAISLGVKIRPQFFSFELHSIKYRFDGTFGHQGNNLTWKTDLSYSIYNHSLTSYNYRYGLFQVINQLNFKLINHLPMNLLFGYSNYDIQYENFISSDLFFLSTIFNKKINNYSFLGFGIFIQRFELESKLNSNIVLTSDGWKYGPQFKVQYMRRFLFNAEYKFLIFNSNNTIYPSFEHNINILTGIIFNRRISIFLLSEFSFIRTKIKTDLNEKNPIFYTPTQNENEIYLKTSFRIKDNLSIYSKIGYFRENYYLEKFKLDGLNFLFGIEIK